MNIDLNIKKYLLLIKYNGKNSEAKNRTCRSNEDTL